MGREVPPNRSSIADKLGTFDGRLFAEFNFVILLLFPAGFTISLLFQ